MAPKNGQKVQRNQVVTPRDSRRLDKSKARRRSAIDFVKFFRTAMSFARPTAVLLIVVLVVLGYNALANSRLFLLRKVTVSEANTTLVTEIEQLIRRSVGQ